jgi:N-acetyl-anhydromuramyl-L-alanine amidase AmpD
MKRIIWHWSAGQHTPSSLDREHYHFIIDGAGKVHNGNLPPEANLSTGDGQYAAHTKGCNTGSIGIAVAAMAGAVERPFKAGAHPVTPAQVEALVKLTRDLAAKYKIPVTRETVLSHAEVQPTLKIAQRGKWDIAWLPGMTAPGNPVAVGDKLRARVSGA